MCLYPEPLHGALYPKSLNPEPCAEPLKVFRYCPPLSKAKVTSVRIRPVTVRDGTCCCENERCLRRHHLCGCAAFAGGSASCAVLRSRFALTPNLRCMPAGIGGKNRYPSCRGAARANRAPCDSPMRTGAMCVSHVGYVPYVCIPHMYAYLIC